MKITFANMVTIPEQIPYIQALQPEWYKSYVSQISMLRLDVLHPVISGNKWYKLKHNIAHAITEGYNSILTFGGAYSNYLIAAAAAAEAYGIRAIGIVRGIQDKDRLTQTLKDCLAHGMQLTFLSKEHYAQKDEQALIDKWEIEFDHPFIIPEGGANEWGRLGAEEIATYITELFSHICVSAGTGTTTIGLRNTLPVSQFVYGYTPVKNGVYLKNEIAPFLKDDKNLNWELFDDNVFGGFGKWNDELLYFMNEFHEINHIPLDIVYTGKMMFKIAQQLKENIFPPDARLLCIHTGGLQGNVSVKDKLCY